MTIRESDIDLDLSMVPEFGAKELFFRLKNFIGENLSLVYFENEYVPEGVQVPGGFGAIDPGFFQYKALPGAKIIQALGRFTIQGAINTFPSGGPTYIYPNTGSGPIPYIENNYYDHKVRTFTDDSQFIVRNYNYNSASARTLTFNAVLFQIRNNIT